VVARHKHDDAPLVNVLQVDGAAARRSLDGASVVSSMTSCPGRERTDEEEGLQIVAGADDMARSAFAVWAGDRRLFTGAASPARVFLALL
jgi:hypothetical protein